MYIDIHMYTYTNIYMCVYVFTLSQIYTYTYINTYTDCKEEQQREELLCYVLSNIVIFVEI